MAEKLHSYRPGDLVRVNFGVKDGPRDVSCLSCRVVQVFNEGTSNAGLALTDRDSTLVLVTARDVTFIRHEGVW